MKQEKEKENKQQVSLVFAYLFVLIVFFSLLSSFSSDWIMNEWKELYSPSVMPRLLK